MPKNRLRLAVPTTNGLSRSRRGFRLGFWSLLDRSKSGTAPPVDGFGEVVLENQRVLSCNLRRRSGPVEDMEPSCPDMPGAGVSPGVFEG